MRNFKFPILIAALSLSLLPAEAGLFDLLRGDQEIAAAPPQRVALVGAAEVKTVTGKVEFLNGVEIWSRVKAGQKLAPGDMIRTQEGAAILKMEESGSFVRVRSGTVVRLRPLEQGWDEGVLTGIRKDEGYVVRSLRGPAEFRSEDGNWQPVAVNTVLENGDVLRTSSRTVLDLYSTSDRRSIRVAGISQIRLSSELTARKVQGAPALASAAR